MLSFADDHKGKNQLEENKGLDSTSNCNHMEDEKGSRARDRVNGPGANNDSYRNARRQLTGIINLLILEK